MSGDKSSPLVRIATGVGTLTSMLLAGAALGMVYVKLFVPRKAMGWDGLADVLGGIMLGGLVGVVIGLALVALVSVRTQLVTMAIAAATAVIAVAGLAATAPKREASPPPKIEKSFQPFFRIGFRVNHTEEILVSVAPEERPFPFTEAKIWTSKPELTRTGWGPEFAECVATPSRADLEALIPPLEATIAAAGPYCQTPEEDLKASLNWRLGSDGGGQGLHAGCLGEMPEVRALVEAVGALADRLCVDPGGGQE